MQRTYEFMAIHMDVDGTQIDREYFTVTVGKTSNEKEDKKAAEKVAECKADCSMPLFDSNSHIIVFIL